MSIMLQLSVQLLLHDFLYYSGVFWIFFSTRGVSVCKWHFNISYNISIIFRSSNVNVHMLYAIFFVVLMLWQCKINSLSCVELNWIRVFMNEWMKRICLFHSVSSVARYAFNCFFCLEQETLQHSRYMIWPIFYIERVTAPHYNK